MGYSQISPYSLMTPGSAGSAGTVCEECLEKLQVDLDKLYYCHARNNMKFNGSKFKLIRYWPKQDLKENPMYFSP